MQRMLKRILIQIWFISACSLIASNRPNVILIYADDLGAGLLGINGQKIIKTPNIDQLAKSGMQFTQSYGCIYCAPARASLITGLHSGRAGAWRITTGGKVIDRDEGKISDKAFSKALNAGKPAKPGEVFLGEIFQRSGYKTAQFGKLEWGFLTSHDRLKRHGWDEYIGYIDHQRAHGFYPTYLWHNGEKLPLKGNTHTNAGKTVESYGKGSTATRRDRTGKETYSQNVFIEHILNFIRNNKDQPFFIYHPTQLPHGPVDIPEVHPDFIHDKRLTAVEKEYASMVKMLDDHVGLIMQELNAQEIDDNTMVLFTSDNGHEVYYWERSAKRKARSIDHHGEGDVFAGTRGLAGKKWTNWEGGITTPLIVRWPGKIKPGTTSDRLTAAYDYMTTFVDLLDQQQLHNKDGVSFLPTLLGKHKQEREYVIVKDAIISGRWKLVNMKKTNYLFDLSNDPGERNNVAGAHPERVNQLFKTLNAERNKKLTAF